MVHVAFGEEEQAMGKCKQVKAMAGNVYQVQEVNPEKETGRIR